MHRHYWVLMVLLLSGTGRAGAQPDVALYVNEILSDPNGAVDYDTDGSGIAAAADEYVEFYNGADSAVDLSGWELWDAGSGRWFIFPPGSTVQPGGYAAVVAGVQAGGTLPIVADGSVIYDAGRGSGVLNNSADNLVFYDPAGNRFWQVVYSGDSPDDPLVDYSGFPEGAQRVGAVVDFGAAREGIARTRAPDGGVEIVDHDTIAAENGSPGRAPAAPAAIGLNAFGQRQPDRRDFAAAAALLTLLTAAWFGRRQEMAGVCRR